MDSFNINGIEVEINNFIKADEGDGGDPKTEKARGLAAIAKFMGAVKVEFFDGDDEKYKFIKADGSVLKVEAACYTQPEVSFIMFDIEK